MTNTEMEMLPIWVERLNDLTDMFKSLGSENKNAINVIGELEMVSYGNLIKSAIGLMNAHPAVDFNNNQQSFISKCEYILNVAKQHLKSLVTRQEKDSAQTPADQEWEKLSNSFLDQSRGKAKRKYLPSAQV